MKCFKKVGLLYISNGSVWNQILLFGENELPGTSLKEVNRFTLFSGGTAANTTVDLSGPASGKRWRVTSLISNHPLISNTISVALQMKVSGTYYSVWTSLGVSLNTASSISPHFPILENGQTLSVYTTVAGANIFISVIEFDDTSPLKSVNVLSLSSGDNTIYTCPSGYTSRILGRGPGAGVLSPKWPGVVGYENESGASRSVYVNFVPVGGSPQAPGANSNCLVGAARNVTTKSSTVAGFSPFCCSSFSNCWRINFFKY
jgi:hypothetical protein